MREILSHLFLPLPLFWIALFLILVFRILRKKILAYRLTWILFIYLFLITTPFLPDLMVRTLENQYKPISAATLKNLKGPINILVLGSGFVYDESLSPTNQLSENALSRLTEGIRIERLLSESKLITSGFGDYEEITSAEIMANAAIELGIDSSRLTYQKFPNNTWQEATEYKRLHPKSNKLIVVTSAVHMPRAIYLFRKAGLLPIAAPTNHLVKSGKHRDPWFWLPSSQNINKMEAAFHEYSGLFWLKLGGS